jgi:hypothetical protein
MVAPGVVVTHDDPRSLFVVERDSGDTHLDEAPAHDFQSVITIDAHDRPAGTCRLRVIGGPSTVANTTSLSVKEPSSSSVVDVVANVVVGTTVASDESSPPPLQEADSNTSRMNRPHAQGPR